MSFICHLELLKSVFLMIMLWSFYKGIPQPNVKIYKSQQARTGNLEQSHQFSSVAQSCPALYDPMDCHMPGFLVHHQLPELAQTQVHRVSDAIQPSHPLSSASPPAFNISQHQGFFLMSSLYQVAKVLELQLHHQSFQ